MISSKEESCSVISSFANANIVSELSKISTDQEQHRKLLMLNDEDTTIYTLLPSSPSSQSPPSPQSFDRVKFFLYEDHFVLKPKSWSFFWAKERKRKKITYWRLWMRFFFFFWLLSSPSYRSMFNWNSLFFFFSIFRSEKKIFEKYLSSTFQWRSFHRRLCKIEDAKKNR